MTRSATDIASAGTSLAPVARSPAGAGAPSAWRLSIAAYALPRGSGTISDVSRR